MTSEVVLDTHYIGKVLPDGHLEIPETVIVQMGLKHGDEVAVVLHKATSIDSEAPIPEEARVLIQELIGTPKSLKETVEALTIIATQMMPQKKQQHLSHLLWKNQDGTITPKEEGELDALVTEGQEAILCKAKGILALKHLGVDIIPDLGARVRGK